MSDAASRTQAAAKHAEERDAAREKIKELTEASSSVESVGNERLKGWEEQKARADGLEKDLEAAKKAIRDVEEASREAAAAAEEAHRGLVVELQVNLPCKTPTDRPIFPVIPRVYRPRSLHASTPRRLTHLASTPPRGADACLAIAIPRGVARRRSWSGMRGTLPGKRLRI